MGALLARFRAQPPLAALPTLWARAAAVALEGKKKKALKPVCVGLMSVEGLV